MGPVGVVVVDVVDDEAFDLTLVPDDVCESEFVSLIPVCISPHGRVLVCA